MYDIYSFIIILNKVSKIIFFFLIILTGGQWTHERIKSTRRLIFSRSTVLPIRTFQKFQRKEGKRKWRGKRRSRRRRRGFWLLSKCHHLKFFDRIWLSLTWSLLSRVTFYEILLCEMKNLAKEKDSKLIFCILLCEIFKMNQEVRSRRLKFEPVTGERVTLLKFPLWGRRYYFVFFFRNSGTDKRVPASLRRRRLYWSIWVGRRRWRGRRNVERSTRTKLVELFQRNSGRSCKRNLPFLFRGPSTSAGSKRRKS